VFGNAVAACAVTVTALAPVRTRANAASMPIARAALPALRAVLFVF
jgi:hypothetical protein